MSGLRSIHRRIQKWKQAHKISHVAHGNRYCWHSHHNSRALNVIAGIVVLVWGKFDMMGDWYRFGGHMGFGITAGLGAVLIVIGIVSVIGGTFALRRRLWGLSLAGAILALFPPRLIVLGILSIIFLALSKGEFDQSGSQAT